MYQWHGSFRVTLERVEGVDMKLLIDISFKMNIAQTTICEGNAVGAVLSQRSPWVQSLGIYPHN